MKNKNKNNDKFKYKLKDKSKIHADFLIKIIIFVLSIVILKLIFFN